MEWYEYLVQALAFLVIVATGFLYAYVASKPTDHPADEDDDPPRKPPNLPADDRNRLPSNAVVHQARINAQLQQGGAQLSPRRRP